MRAAWRCVRLGDICSYDKNQGANVGLQYVGLEHIESGTGCFQEGVDQVDAKSLTFRYSAKHVLYGRLRPYLKKVALPSHDGRCSTEIFPILPSNDLVREYLAYWLLTDATTAAINATCTGARMPRADMNEVLDFEFLLPSPQEQQRIVAILDEAFAGIAAAKANAEKNLQNARELFDSELSSVFTKLVDEAPQRVLSSLCRRITVGHVGSMASRYKDSGVVFLRSQNVRPFEIDLKNAVFIDEDFHAELSKSRLTPGDLAIVRTGYPGTAAVIPESLSMANCSDLVIVRPNEQVCPEYLALFFNSEFGKRLVAGKAVGAAQKHFNVTSAKEVMLPLPSRNEQARVVDDCHLLRDEGIRLENLFRRKLNALDELKQSLLAKAFAGELS